MLKFMAVPLLLSARVTEINKSSSLQGASRPVTDMDKSFQYWMRKYMRPPWRGTSLSTATQIGEGEVCTGCQGKVAL